MENEKREETAAEQKREAENKERLTIRYCGSLEEEKCRCGRTFKVPWLAIVGETSGKAICGKCASGDQELDIVSIYEEVLRYAETVEVNAFQEGVGAGKKDAAEMIFHAIDETPIERVRRICFKLGAFEESPF